MRAADTLHGWKQIASALNVGVRTAQRWEAIAGLPVHRLNTGIRGSVFTTKEEIGAWMAKRSATTPTGPLESRSASFDPPRAHRPDTRTVAIRRANRRSVPAGRTSEAAGSRLRGLRALRNLVRAAIALVVLR